MIADRVTFLGDVPLDYATAAQRARMDFLASQLHALGLSISQAQARGDTVTVTTLRATVDKLYTEQLALQKAIIAQGNTTNAAVAAGAYDTPLEQVASALKKVGIGAALGLGVLAYLAMRR